MQVTLIVTKSLLGLFVSGTLAAAFYFLTLPFLISILRPEIINGLLVTILTISIGAGVGAYFTWFERDVKLNVQVALFVLTFVFTIVGAYIGLQRGIELMPSYPAYKFGLPVLWLTARGAIVSANTPLLAMAIYRAWTNRRM